MGKDAPGMRLIIASVDTDERDDFMAEINYDGEQWAEVSSETHQLTLFPRRDGAFWVFDFDEALKALNTAKERVKPSQGDTWN